MTIAACRFCRVSRVFPYQQEATTFRMGPEESAQSTPPFWFVGCFLFETVQISASHIRRVLHRRTFCAEQLNPTELLNFLSAFLPSAFVRLNSPLLALNGTNHFFNCCGCSVCLFASSNSCDRFTGQHPQRLSPPEVGISIDTACTKHGEIIRRASLDWTPANFSRDACKLIWGDHSQDQKL